MQRLITPITALALQEADWAKANRGPAYASHHEAYGVLAEEVQEVGQEHKSALQHMDYLLRFVRADYTDGIEGCLRVIQQDAIRAAAESIQVAAVCSRWLDGMAHD